MASKSAKANENSASCFTLNRSRAWGKKWAPPAAAAQSGHFHFRLRLGCWFANYKYYAEKTEREREWKSFMNKKNAGTYHKVLIYFTVNETFMVALSPSNRHGGWKERHKKNKKLFQLILRWLLYMIHLAFNSTRHVFFLMREIEMID